MRYLAAIVTAASMAACNLADSKTRVQQLGLLRLSAEDSINFVAPDTVQLSQTFTISATTFGGNCDSKGPTDVLELTDGSIYFRPFVVTEVNHDRQCTLDPQTFTHTGNLSRSVAGPVTITLWGRDWDGLITSRAKSVYVRP